MVFTAEHPRVLIYAMEESSSLVSDRGRRDRGAIFAGRTPWSLSLTKLDPNLPFSWKEQMKLFDME